MATVKVSKSELASESSNLSNIVSQVSSTKAALISALSSVSDIDGIGVSAAGQTLASNIDNAITDLMTCATNIKNYSAAISAADVRGKDGRKVDDIQFSYSVSSDGSRSGNIVAIWNYFKNKGLSDAAICGILGNISAECGFDPSAIEGNGEGHGLIQWSFDRKTKFLNAAKSAGVDWRDLNFQLDYLWNESVDPNTYYGKRLKKAGFYDSNVSIGDAAYMFHSIVEGSNDTESMIQNNRVAVAKNLYSKYKDTVNVGTNSTISSDGIKRISSIESAFSKSAINDTGATVTDNGAVSNTSDVNTNTSSGGVYDYGGATSSGAYVASSVGGSGGSGGSSGSSSSNNDVNNSSVDEAEDEEVEIVEGDVSTPSKWIKNSTSATTNVAVNTKSGKKTFTIFEQRFYNQYNNGGWNLSSNGCAVCTTTTIIRAYGDEKYKNATPADVINKGNGGRPFNFFGDGIKNALDTCGVKYKYKSYGPGDAQALAEQLKQGTPMIVSVRGNGRFFANSSGHTIALLGLTDDGKVIVGDSYCAFHGSTTYTMNLNDIFSVMCNDPCSSYDNKEVLIIDK